MEWFAGVCRVLVAMAWLVAVVLFATESRAEERDRAHGSWTLRRRLETGPADVAITAAAVGVTIGGNVVSPRAEHVRGGVLFDEDVRDALRIRSAAGREAVRDASDAGLVTAIAAPFLVDALVVSWLYRDDPKLARDVALVSAEALALGAAMQGITNNVASRERPYGRLCGTEISEDNEACRGNVRYRSFFSGHATLTFAGAATMCMNHVGLGLLGGPWDGLTCALGVAAAGTTAVFRVAGDMHYASDVLVGAGVGTAVGLLVPLLHFHSDPRTSRIGVDVRVAPVASGFGLTGTF